MAQTPKRRPGRPRKSPLEQQEQFSIRLIGITKLELEIIARQNNCSLSQAVNVAITKVAHTTKVSPDKTVATAAREGLAEMFKLLPPVPVAPGAIATIPPERVYYITGAFSEASKAIAFPEELKSEEERYFTEVMKCLAERHSRYPLMNNDELMELFEFCRTSFLMGTPAEEVTASWAKRPVPPTDTNIEKSSTKKE